MDLLQVGPRSEFLAACLARGRPRSIEERDRGPRLRSSGRAIEQEQCVTSAAFLAAVAHAVLHMGVTTNDDIVWRIIEKRLFYGKTYHEISEDLLVPMTTVFDIVKRSSERASFATWQGARCSLPANATLDRRQRWLLLDLILEADDDTQLDELSDLFFKAEGMCIERDFDRRCAPVTALPRRLLP